VPDVIGLPEPLFFLNVSTIPMIELDEDVRKDSVYCDG
jgi:hypothetical protein